MFTATWVVTRVLGVDVVRHSSLFLVKQFCFEFSLWVVTEIWQSEQKEQNPHTIIQNKEERKM